MNVTGATIAGFSLKQIKYLNFPCKFDLIADVQIYAEVQQVPNTLVEPGHALLC